MGAEYVTAQAPVLKIRASGTAKLHRIELIRNGKVILREGAKDRDAEIQYEDQKIQNGHYYYCVRVIQEREGEDNYRGIAVTSPIWITLR
jgi:hypothetical protein